MSIPRSLERGLGLLELVLEHPGGVSFSDICQHAKLPNTTVNRLLIALCGLEYIEKEESGLYMPGLRLSELGARETVESYLRRVFYPRLEELSGRTGCTTILIQWTGYHAICLERVMRPESTPMVRRGYVSRDILSSPWGVLFLSKAGWRREAKAVGLAGHRMADAVRRYDEEQARFARYGFTCGHTSQRQRIAAPLRTSKGRIAGAIALGIGQPFVSERALLKLGRQVAESAGRHE